MIRVACRGLLELRVRLIRGRSVAMTGQALWMMFSELGNLVSV